MSKKNIFFLAVGVFLGAALAGYGLPRLFPYTFHGMVLQAPEPAPEFALTDQYHQPVSLKRFEGKLVILFFGYTSCPDVCPATLGVLSQAMQLLGQEAEAVQVLYISVDPARDTPERLAEYVTHFNPNFLGVTGTPEEIAQTAALYGVYYEIQEKEAEEIYWIDHTASLMVIDQQGRLKLVLPFGVSAEEVAADLRRLLR
ncbi:MAG: SCO family protein [Anaerolineales bacterium]